MFGSRISTIAFPMLVLHLSDSPFLAGLVAFATIAPSILIYIPAGALVDRMNPRKVMLGSELGRGIAVATVVIALTAHRKPSVSLLIIVMVAEEILEIFSTLADRRYVNCLVDRGNTSHAQACIEVRTHAVVLAGRPIGPFLFELRPIWPFLADAASFVVSVASLICIRGTNAVHEHLPRMPKRRLRSDIGEGFRWLYDDKYALITAALMASTTLIAQALVMIFLAEAHAHSLSTFAVGFVLAASGLGGALGSMCARWVPGWARSCWLQIQMCAWCAALALLATPGKRPFEWVAAAMAILGFTGAIGNIEFGTYLVRKAGTHRLARVTSIGQVLAISGAALGPLLGGTAIQRYGGHGALLRLFIAVMILTVISLTRPGTWAKVAVRVLRPMEWMVLADVAVAGCFAALRKRHLIASSATTSPKGVFPCPAVSSGSAEAPALVAAFCQTGGG